jgi:glycine/D-amino acid oxidase-like deaminating enzyme
LLLGGYEPDPLQVDVSTLGADFEIADLALDFEPLRKLTHEVRDEFPVLQGAGIDEFRGGLPTMTADGRHIVDRVAGVDGFFVASGCCVGGLSISPAVGEALGAWIVDGEPALDLSSLRLTRELDTEDRARRACGATRKVPKAGWPGPTRPLPRVNPLGTVESFQDRPPSRLYEIPHVQSPRR